MSDVRDGSWIDKWGSCRVCGGEIPHGHSHNCDYWMLEQELQAVKKDMSGLEKKATVLFQKAIAYDKLRKAAEALVARESIYSVHSIEFKELCAAISK